MHMADALVSPEVGTVMLAAGVGALALATVKMKKEDDLDEKKIPIMAVTGALVFAAQMINFTIPGTGSSGHIGGGILLAAMLGPYAGTITLTAVLIIQCLIFADGGLLALGCNIFNMAVIPCMLAYPFIYRPILGKAPTAGRITAASITAVVVGLQLGAFAVVVETLASGVTELPFGTFVSLMQPIHLAIGLVEGIVTAAILNFVRSARPELLRDRNVANVSTKKLVVVFAGLAVVIAGILSIFASGNPDGLEWAILKTSGQEEIASGGVFYEFFGGIQEKLSFLPDYSGWFAGLVGVLIVAALVGIVAAIIYSSKRRKRLNKKFS